MARITTRLTELEKKIQPVEEIVVVFKDVDKYWRATACDYRQTVGGEGCYYLTLEEVQALERAYNVIMVEWVHDWRANTTLAGALTDNTGEEVTTQELP